MDNQPIATVARDPSDRLKWSASLPFLLTHLSVFLIPLTGIKWQYVLLALASYYGRMLFVCLGYHRYFSHRTFKTNRVFQFILAFGAQTSMQKGALWWAAHHRDHHRHSDQPEDIHSPVQKGFFWSHMGWIMSGKYDETKMSRIADFARFPELVWLNTWHLVPALIGAVVLFALGGFPALLWGGLLPSILLWHGTFTINSLSHIWGSRRYLTTDTSRNNFLFALITCGEGWHNNHHSHQNTANQGWFWWEIDLAFYVLKLLSWVGLVKDLRVVSAATRDAYLQYTPEQKASLRGNAWFHSRKAQAYAAANALKDKVTSMELPDVNPPMTDV